MTGQHTLKAKPGSALRAAPPLVSIASQSGLSTRDHPRPPLGGNIGVMGRDVGIDSGASWTC